MAEAFLFPLAQSLTEKLATTAFQKIGRIWGVESDLKRLEGTLSSIKAVLSDAAQKQINSEQVRDWLEKLQDVLYDLDDLFDHFTTDEMRRELDNGDIFHNKVTNFFSRSNKIVFRVKMSGKIKKLRERLDEINEDRRNYKFDERFMRNHSSYRPRAETHAFVHASDVIGRDHEKEEILRLLLDSKSSDANLRVLPIVGLGGLGKTTLTKLIYNDPEIENNFQMKIWVSVSEDFEIKSLLKKILKVDTCVDFQDLDLDQLRTSLQNCLRSQKFFLVLDDVWNKNPIKWSELIELLNNGVNGSTIVVTTRSQTVAEMVGTLKPYLLSSLLSHDCLSIFLKSAFKDGQGQGHPRLVEIGEEIVKKCGGLPLAVKTLASLLRTTTEESEWNFIKNNEIWKIPQEENGVLPILRLSYDQMPIHLKQCFAYCSNFPKDAEFRCASFIYHWISHGLIHSSHANANRSLEEIAYQYINDLVSRYFFQDVVYDFANEVWSFKLHDLVHDLARLVAGKEVVHFDSNKNIHQNVRHMLYTKEILDGKTFPKSLPKLEKLRSFRFQWKMGSIKENWLDTLIKSFKRLHSLDLNGTEFEKLPKSIGTLRHLRFLRLAGNSSIVELPDSICKLLNLMFLDLFGCYKLQKLPANFNKLRRLRHLRLTLKMICLSEKDLQGLGSLRIFSIYKCSSMEYISDAGLGHLTTLHALYIKDCPRLTSIPQSIKFLTSLKKLYIWGCEQLTSLDEKGFEGLESLECLLLVELPLLRKVPLKQGSFLTKLKYLWILNCTSLKSLEGLNNYSSLLELRIRYCSCLESLSSNLDRLVALRYLDIIACPYLIAKCKREGGEYWPWIKSIPKTYISELGEVEESSVS